MSFPNYPSGQPAAQTLFQLGTGACPDAFVSVANVITGPKLTFKIREVETTAHPITQTGSATIAATYIPTITERNLTMDISIKTDTAAYDLLVSLAKGSTFFDWRIVNADYPHHRHRGAGILHAVRPGFPGRRHGEGNGTDPRQR